MRTFFIDETERQKQTSGNYQFSLCGLIVDNENIVKLSNEIENIKTKYKISNLKESRKSGWDEPRRIAITEELITVLAANGATVRASILGEIALRDVREISENYFGAFVFLLERFFITLAMEDDFGMIIFDSMNETLQSKLRKELFDFISKEELIMRGASKGSFKDRIFPAVLFSKDEYNNILQASDLIANCLVSAVWHYRKSEAIFDVERITDKNPFLKIYWPLFVKNSSGNVNGWGIKIWW